LIDYLQPGELGAKDMRGVKVTFHRTNFWVYGRKMAKADLSYVVQPNQKVVVECTRITAKERQVQSVEGLKYFMYRRRTVLYMALLIS
jgi:hypothetical protein